jgi:DNA-binding GntR family transcriptional regulator
VTTDAVGMTKTQAAYSSIRRDIESGEFPPGARLRVSALQAKLGISPTPIREALRMLQSDGVVTNLPHQGMAVTAYEPDDVEEVYRLRELLEPLAAEFAARNRTEEEVARLTELHEGIAAAVRDGDDSLAAELNAQWHAAIVEASHSRLVEDFSMRLRVVLPLTGLWLGSHATLSVREHRKVVAAIAKGDGEAAGAAMRSHVDRGHRQAAKRFATKVKD